MKEHKGHRWLLAVLGVALILILVGAGFSAAKEAEGSFAANPEGDEGGLIGIRLVDADLAQLAAWGIRPQPAPDGDATVVHVTEEQLERLQAEGLSYELLGRVAVFTKDDAHLLGSCYGNNGTDVTIAFSPSESHIDLSSCSAYSGALVTNVYYYIDLETNFSAPYCPRCYAQLDIDLANSSHSTRLHSQESSCCLIGLSSEGDEKLATTQCTMSGYVSSFFDGDLVKQDWWITLQNTCHYRSSYTLVLLHETDLDFVLKAD